MTDKRDVEMASPARPRPRPKIPTRQESAYFAGVIPNQMIWQDVKYSVSSKKDNQVITKTILKGISGGVQSGEMLAIMGPSGSGKR
jgi:ABC-type multidrug transport system fused ATPase/permease subunit